MLALVPIGLLTLVNGKLPALTLLAGCGLLSASLSLVVMHRLMLKHQTDTVRWRVHAAQMATAVSAWPLIAFYGAHAAFAGILGLVLLVNNQSASRPWAAAITLTVAAPHLVLGLATTFGTLPELGVLCISSNPAIKLANLLGIALIYAFSFILGQANQQRTRDGLIKLQEAAQQLAMREAILRQARMELERVELVGREGRLTGAELGSYRLGVLLGSGGMGEIYEARHIVSGAEAAVKVIRRPDDSGHELIAPFVREAVLASRIDSPHVVRILEVGGFDAPLPYIAMERLHGKDLSQLLQEKGVLRGSDVLELARQVALGIDAAASAGIVHRDINPRNLFRCDDGTWKLLDFGIARLVADARPATHLVGTPSYLAPEQVRGAIGADHRTDVHAFGVVLYRAVTGRSPFASRNLGELLEHVCTSLPPRPSLLSRWSSQLDAVLRIALAKDPADRFDSATELASALAKAALNRLDEEAQTRAARLNERLCWSSADND